NPVAGATKAKVTSSPPGILTVDEAARLLEAATPDVLPYIAIGLFAGLRSAELERLDWSEVDFESGLIEVTAQKSKTASRRFVPMQDNLRQWLLKLHKHAGNVTPFGFAYLVAQARKRAGINEWPSNALRHSFASYHLAHFNDINTLTLQMGHTNT